MDVEKTIQFIVEQQARYDARFDTGMQKLQEMDAALGRRIDETSRQIQALTAAQFKQLETVNLLVNRVARQEHRTDQFDQRMEQLASAQQRTEDNLNSLITVVDGLVRGKR